ncbi:MAG: RNase adapter RapZ [Firmicutes bacterium]|nr:RNase adapter RapZ [Bacillota bacterium]
MKFIIVTGMSGAGKSSVLKFLEDVGFFCVDNLPPFLILKFAQMYFEMSTQIKKVAIGIDIRGGKLFNDLFFNLEKIDKANYKILFLDASDNVLVKRFKETRRVHPIAKAKSERIIFGIKKEREILKKVKSRADYIIDTSFMKSNDLKEKINDIFVAQKKFDGLMINIISFGFKYGIPEDSDLVFDVRFLPNPFYIKELKNLTGNDLDVKNYVLKFELSHKFLDKVLDLINFLIPNYIHEGKNQLVISIGCTGGKHRSVTIANEIYKKLFDSGRNVLINHRDIKIN